MGILVLLFFQQPHEVNMEVPGKGKLWLLLPILVIHVSIYLSVHSSICCASGLPLSRRTTYITPWDCHRTSKLNFKDVSRTSEISFVRPKSIPETSKNCQKARPLLTSCMMFALPTYRKFATCVDWALRTSHFPLAGVLLTAVSSVAAPFWWLRDHCVYLSRVLSWLIDVCIIKLSTAIPENIRWNYMKSFLFFNIHEILNYYFAKNVCRLKTPQHFRELPSEIL